MKKTYVYNPARHLRPSAKPFNETCCAAAVTPAGYGHGHQCRNKGKLEEEGYLWCKTHAPSSEQTRHQALREREQARWDRHPVMQLARATARLEALQRALQHYLDGWPDNSSVVDLAAALKASRDV
jgi:hypothetical protein